MTFAEFVEKEFPGQEFIPPTNNAFMDFAKSSATKVVPSSCDLDDYKNLEDEKIVYVHDVSDTSGHRLFICGDWGKLGSPRFAQSGGHPAKLPSAAMDLIKNHFVW